MSWDFPAKINSSEGKKEFLAKHIFHERQMNSCPIGCEGCAVEANTTAQGSMNFSDLKAFYEEAKDLGVALKITKVEGYDPVFVNYQDDTEANFADSLKLAIDLGHTIITPLCTTGSWKSDKSIKQLTEIGKLSNEYRRYTYPSGKLGEAFVLSVPREIRPYANGKYNYNEHINKIVYDIQLLTVGGNLDVLVYHNSKVEDDINFARKIKDEVTEKLTEEQRARTNIFTSDFNAEITPESCMRYENSILVSPEGFSPIDPVVLEWEADKTPSLAAA